MKHFISETGGRLLRFQPRDFLLCIYFLSYHEGGWALFHIVNYYSRAVEVSKEVSFYTSIIARYCFTLLIFNPIILQFFKNRDIQQVSSSRSVFLTLVTLIKLQKKKKKLWTSKNEYNIRILFRIIVLHKTLNIPI